MAQTETRKAVLQGRGMERNHWLSKRLLEGTKQRDTGKESGGGGTNVVITRKKCRRVRGRGYKGEGLGGPAGHPVSETLTFALRDL